MHFEFYLRNVAGGHPENFFVMVSQSVEEVVRLRSSSRTQCPVIDCAGSTHCHGGYHLAQNNYSFDALQAYCFGINIKL